DDLGIEAFAAGTRHPSPVAEGPGGAGYRIAMPVDRVAEVSHAVADDAEAVRQDVIGLGDDAVGGAGSHETVGELRRRPAAAVNATRQRSREKGRQPGPCALVRDRP